MVEPDIDDILEFNEQIIAEFRANDRLVGGLLAGTPIMRLHHIGAKSGVERVTPLAYNRQGDGSFVIVASNAGSPTHPGWYYNLKTNPRIEVLPPPQLVRQGHAPPVRRVNRPHADKTDSPPETLCSTQVDGRGLGDARRDPVAQGGPTPAVPPAEHRNAAPRRASLTYISTLKWYPSVVPTTAPEARSNLSPR